MNVLSLFDGISCGQVALDRANIKIDNYFASEIDKYAISITQKNYPGTIQLGSVVDVKASDLPQIDLLIGGSPCFAAGTKVICKDNYKNIEDIEKGDYVLTHTNSFQKVINIGGKKANTYLLEAQGVLPTITTEEHPYYTRKMTRKWNNPKRTSERVFSDPVWKKVKDLTKNDFIGIPINSLSENVYNLTEDEAYIIGRYIADGHTRKDFRVSEGRPNDRHWQLVLSIGKTKLNDFAKNVQSHYSCYPHSQSVFRCVFSNKRLVEIVEKECGCGAINKKISQTLLNLPNRLLEKLINGFLDGDGCQKKGVFKVTTISRELAMALCMAIPKVYRTNANIEFTKRAKTHIICGREVNQKDTYTVSFQKQMKKQSHAVIVDNIVWFPIKKIEQTDNVAQVYNLEVNKDNSYTANNAIVHNCQGFSYAGKQLNFNDPRSVLFFEYVRLLKECKPKYFLLENVMMSKESENVISNYLGIKPIRINSALVSAQNRERLYWTNINSKITGFFDTRECLIKQPLNKGILLKDVLEDKVDRKYFIKKATYQNIISHKERLKAKGNGFGIKLNELDKKCQALTVGGKCINDLVQLDSKNTFSIYQKGRGYNKGGVHTEKAPALTSNDWVNNNLLCKRIANIGSGGQGQRVYDVNAKSVTLSALGGGQGAKTGLYEIQEDVRRLTPIECERLQTLPDNYTEGISDTQRYKALGNGWTVDVIAHILKHINQNELEKAA